MENKVKVIDKRLQETPETDVQVQGESPAAMMIAAVSKGMDLEKLEKFMLLQQKYEENEARKAFHKALSQFKADPPKIWRDLQVKYEVGNKSTEWSHSDLGKAADAINASLGKYGLNSTWRTSQDEKNVTVTCMLTHELGHTESTSLSAAPDTSGSKNSIQAIGSTVFYLERYTLFAITGLAPIRMDDDGVKSEAVSKKYDDWLVKLGEMEDSELEELEQWWPKYKDTVKKECTESEAAQIYTKYVEMKKEKKNDTPF